MATGAWRAPAHVVNPFAIETTIDELAARANRSAVDYRMIRMREAPLAIESHFLPSRLRPTGFGEPPLPPMAPSVANAIAAPTGERIRVMPFSKAGYVLG